MKRSLEAQLLGVKSGIKYWEEYYEMTDQQCDFLKRLYDLRIMDTDKVIKLNKNLLQYLECDSEIGINASLESFREIDIWFV